MIFLTVRDTMRFSQPKSIGLIISIIFILPVIAVAQSVTFTFNPPDSTRSTIFATTNETEIAMMNETNKRRIDHYEELYVKTDSNFTVTGTLLTTDSYDDEVDESRTDIAFMIGMPLTYVIDSEGRLDSLVGYERWQQAIFEHNEDGFAMDMPHYFDYEPFFIRITTDWKNQVGDFVGKTFEIGDTIYVTDTVTNIEGTSIIEKKVWFAEMTDYDGARCVVIEYEHSIDMTYSEIYKDALRESFSDPESDYGDPDFEILDDHTDVKGKQIMDPATMLIYYSYEESAETMQIQMFGGLNFAAQTYTVEESKSEYEFKDD
jgi:hypothetical protein